MCSILPDVNAQRTLETKLCKGAHQKQNDRTLTSRLFHKAVSSTLLAFFRCRSQISARLKGSWQARSLFNCCMTFRSYRQDRATTTEPQLVSLVATVKELTCLLGLEPKLPLRLQTHMFQDKTHQHTYTCRC